MAHSPHFEINNFEDLRKHVEEIDYARLAAENVNPYDRESGQASLKVIGGVGAVALVLVAGMYIKGRIDDTIPKIPSLHDLTKLVEPHNDYSVQAQAALDKVTMPGSIILVEGQGTAHAHMTYSGGFGPRTSWNPFNTSQTADSVYPSAKDQVILQGGGIKLIAKHRDGEAADKGYYVDAQVDVSDLVSQFVGQPVTSTNENWQASAARVFHSVNEGSEGDVTAAIASSNYQNSCGVVLTPVIPSGIEAVVYKQLYGFEYLAQQEPDGQGDATAAWLEEMRTSPMQVEYVQKVDNGSAQIPAAHEATSVANFKLPKVPADTKESFANENKVKESDIKDWQVDPSCHVSQSTQDAIRQWSYQNNPNVETVEPSPTAEALSKK